MYLSGMELKNFKCFPHLVVEFGKKTKVTGDNEKGKSTLLEGFTWLFFSRCGNSSKIEYPKPIVDGKLQRKTDIFASAVVDGVSFSRTVKENWNTVKGRSQEEFKGHSSTYEIDGLPVSQKEFTRRVNGMFGDIELFKILSKVDAFINLDWKKRRAFLMENEGDQLKEKSEEIAKVKSRMSLLKKSSQEYGPRIDELNNSIEKVEFDSKELASYKIKLQNSQNEKAAIENGGEFSVIKDSISNKQIEKNDINNQIGIDNQAQLNIYNSESIELSNKLINLQQEAQDNKDLESSEKNKGRQEALRLKDRIQTNINNEKRNLGVARSELNDHLELRSNLRRLWDQEKASEYNGETSCPTCKRELPAEKVEAAKASFNLNRSTELENITSRGIALTAKIIASEDLISAIGLGIATLESELESVVIPELITLENTPESEEIKDLKNKIKNPPAFTPVVNPERQERVNVLTKEIEELQTQLDNKHSAYSSKIEKIDEDIQCFEEAIESLVELQEKQRQNDTTTSRISELHEEQLQNGQNIADCENDLFRLEDEIKGIIEKTESSLNSRFSFTNWKLFETQVNGGIAPCCIPVVDGIEYEKLNTAMKMNCGIDIINTISREKGVNFPLFIDNAECNTNIESTDSQTIKLYVVEGAELETEIVEA